MLVVVARGAHLLPALARGAYLLLVATMLVAYAANITSAPPPEPEVPTERIYS